MKKYKKLLLVLMLSSSFFLTGCDVEQIMQTITNISQAVQQAAPAIGQVIESVQGIVQSFDSLSSNNDSAPSSAPTSSSASAPVEQASNDTPNVIIPPAGEQETITRTDDESVIVIAPDNADDDSQAIAENDSAALPIIGQIDRSLRQLQERINSGEAAAEVKAALEGLKQRLDQASRFGAALSDNLKEAFEELSDKVVSLEEQIEEQLSQETPTALSQKVLRIAVGLDPVDLSYDIDGDGQVTSQDALQLMRLEVLRTNTEYSDEVRSALEQLERKFAQAQRTGEEMPEDLRELFESIHAAAQ